jgi:hypothetical protein
MTTPAADLVPLRDLEYFLDAEGLGSGPAAVRIGDGASNLTYLVEREGVRVALRRPPPPPLPPWEMSAEGRLHATNCPRRRVAAVDSAAGLDRGEPVEGARPPSGRRLRHGHSDRREQRDHDEGHDRPPDARG